MLNVTTVAIYSLGVSWIASGRSSENDIHSIAPAANHKPQGSNGSKRDTKINAGTAIIGWGSDEKIARPTAFRGLTPLGTMTEAIASHSGIFWIAITHATSSHSFRLGQKANHIAIPSVPLCTVIIARKSNICAADFHDMFQKLMFSSLSCTNFLARMMMMIPTNMPRNTRHTLYSIPALIIPKLAAIMSHAAIDFAIPTPLGEILRMKKNGITHSPQANDVASE